MQFWYFGKWVTGSYTKTENVGVEFRKCFNIRIYFSWNSQHMKSTRLTAPSSKGKNSSKNHANPIASSLSFLLTSNTKCCMQFLSKNKITLKMISVLKYLLFTSLYHLFTSVLQTWALTLSLFCWLTHSWMNFLKILGHCFKLNFSN